MIKVPGAQRKDATKGEGNSSPNPENRGNFPACSLRKIDRILSQMPFFLTFFSCRGSRRVEKGKKILSRGKCLQGVKMPETVPTMLLARGWSAGVTECHLQQQHSVNPSRVPQESQVTLHHPKGHTAGPTEELGCTVLLDPKGRRTSASLWFLVCSRSGAACSKFKYRSVKPLHGLHC